MYVCVDLARIFACLINKYFQIVGMNGQPGVQGLKGVQ